MFAGHDFLALEIHLRVFLTIDQNTVHTRFVHLCNFASEYLFLFSAHVTQESRLYTIWHPRSTKMINLLEFYLLSRNRDQNPAPQPQTLDLQGMHSSIL